MLIVVVIGMLLGVDPSTLVEMLNEGSTPQKTTSAPASKSSTSRTAPKDELADFVSVVLADTEDTWRALFQQMKKTYRNPKLVLFTGAVNSACGFAQAAMGPFYCSGDQKVYIDLGFYKELKDRFKAPGDFAQAYVIAHEVGHHVQNLLGIFEQVAAQQAQVNKKEANKLSVKLELQADCLAGVWANRADKARKIIEQGDVAEALNAATAIGDDRLQKQAQGYVVPDTFTHGTSAQRVAWFKQGLTRGDVAACNTFKAR
jgi:uncharacterized protein